MNKKWKIARRVVAGICSVVIVIAAILFFPLNGKRHVQIWSASDEFNINSIKTIEKKPGKEFKILQITDLQLWTNPVDNKKALNDIKTLVEKTKPNFIVTVGDNVSGATSRFLIKDFIKVMDSFKIPWTITYGNHDNEIPMTTLNWQTEQYMKSEYCMLEKGPSNLYGSGNHLVNITENGKPIQTLFMFDNGRYIEYDNGDKKEIYMGYEQMAWYKWNVQGIEKATGNIVPSMTFNHFAAPEFRTAVEKYGVLNEKTGEYTIPSEFGSGKCAYLPGVSPVNSGFFELCKDLGSTKYMFFGHDHENNALINYEGITLTYGLKTGPSPAPWNDATEMGGTVITIDNADKNYKVNIENVII